MIKTIIKKYLLLNAIVTFTIYTIVYLCKTFIIWDFTNPFKWILDIPYYTEETRMNILFFYICYQILLFFIAFRKSVGNNVSFISKP